MPRVTVIMATYNWSTVLPFSIGSALAQTFTDFELLVVGDGCTDDSARVVAAIEDPRVRWIDLQPATGHQSGPNNEGLRQARGELIAYLGHDDLWLPHHLASAVAAIDAGADLAHSILAMVLPEGRPQPITPVPSGWMPPSCVVHRRRMTEDIGVWRDYRETPVNPEHELWLRAAAAGYTFAFVPRMTGVKIPASMRRDVYRDRPCHEQAAWLARIRSEPDLEVVELSKMVVALNGRFLTRFSARVSRLLSQPSQWLAFVWRRKGRRIRAVQRFKGADRSRIPSE